MPFDGVEVTFCRLLVCFDAAWGALRGLGDRMTTEAAEIELCVPVLRGSGRTAAVLDRLDDGRTALYAYTSEEELRECCGDGRRWITARIDRVNRLAAVSGGCDLVLLDAVMSEQLRRAMDADHEPEVEDFAPRSWMSSPIGRQ